MTPDPDAAVTLTPEQVAPLLGPGWSRFTVVRLMETRQLRAVNKGRGKNAHWRTSRAWVEEFLAGRRGQTVGNAPLAEVVRGLRTPLVGLQYAKLRKPALH